ncbi:hypothetical protein Dda_2545 [Drechslerella dactyloides]|uniref:NmrA-like domain-containing protein n=1 Tax=Drechslerella dactyloides TaxID=74499 RepID=A0AAD6NJH4_DREDA|nr:hypothetical protein Dda_2545 [Drechslerella dactyloides]
MASKRTILITGVTGNQGGAVLQALRSHPAYPSLAIRALVRNPAAAAKKLSDPSITLHTGDLTVASSLAPALVDVHTAFLVTTPKPNPAAETAQGITFIDAAVAAGVQFIVFTSVGSADQNTGIPHFESKRRIEEHLERSGIPHAIIRPVAFMDSFPVAPGILRFLILGMFRTAMRGRTLQFVAVKDIGEVAVMAIMDEAEWAGKAIELAGDEVSVDGLLDVYQAVMGARPWVCWVPGWLLRALLPTDIYLMFKFFYERGYNADIPALQKMHPGLLTLEAFLQDKVGKKTE